MVDILDLSLVNPALLFAAHARETEEILELVIRAQMKLRATQRNWDEQCLFDADNILTEIAARLHKISWSRADVEAIVVVTNAASRPTPAPADGAPAEHVFCECPSCHATGLPELFLRRR